MPGGQSDGPLYCCGGCALAARIIGEAGLGRYYQDREAPAPTPAPLSASIGWEASPCDEGGMEAILRVEGLRCASCVWVTERVLQQTPGVLEASISYATGRTRLRFDPAVTALPTLAARIAALGYRPQPADALQTPDRDLLLRLGVAAFCTSNVMMIAAGVYLGWWDGMEPRFERLFAWASLLLATPVALWAAVPFYRGAWAGLQARTLHLDAPIALAVAGMYAHGVAATLAGGHTWLDSLVMLVTLLLGGRVLEQGGRRRTAEAALALANQAPRDARRRTPTGPEWVAVRSLQVGDLIEVGPGEEIGADGPVVEGHGEVQQMLLTGEARPAPVGPGDQVVAGGMLVEGALAIRVEAVGSQSVIGRMATALEAATLHDRAGAERTPADRLAPWFTGGTLVVGAATWLGWTLAGQPATAATATIAVLVVACPCALALAGPLSVAAGLGAAARRGLLLRSGDALRRLAAVDLVAIDKTGTLTEGRLAVAAVVPADGLDASQALRIAAALERVSSHPVGRALVEEARAQGLDVPLCRAACETVGQGVQGEVEGQRWRIGRAAAGEVALYRGDSGTAAARFLLRDQPRDAARDTVARLQAAGLRVVMLTGDHFATAQPIAIDTQVDAVHADLRPEDKARWVQQQQALGHRVLFVGDGLNDGPALAASDVGLAMGTGARSTVLVADGVVTSAALTGSTGDSDHLALRSLHAAVLAARLAVAAAQRSTRRSVVYNVVAVIAAAFGLVNPLVAAVLMPLSSAVVIAGAWRIEGQVARGADA